MAVMDYSLVQRIIDGTGQILDTTPGSPDTGSYVTEAQLRDWIKAGILFSGYYYNGNFYSDSGHTSPLAKVEGALYVDKTNANKALYVCLSSTYQSLTEEAQVQAIIDGLNNGTLVPLKAKQDQNGNVIDTTYETKADANDLKNALDSTNARVENLEQEHGSYHDVDVKSVYTIPSGKAKNWSVNVLRGVTRGRNNAIYLPSSSRTSTQNGITFTDNRDGSYTVSGTATADTTFLIETYPALTTGHTCLMSYGVLCVSGKFRIGDFNNGNSLAYDVGAVYSATSAGGYLAVQVFSGATVNFTCHPTLTDLNLYFGGSIPSDADTIAEIQQNYPELLVPSNYGNSLVSTRYEGVKSVGSNLIDWSAITTDAFVRSADGEVQSYGSGDVNATDYIPVVGGSSYFLGGILAHNYGNSGAIYDINKNYVGAIDNYTDLEPITIPANGAYVRLSLWLACFSDAENSTYFTLNSNPHAFTPYMESTLSLPSPVTLRSAGSVAEEYDLETGEKTNPIGNYTFTGNDNWQSYSDGYILEINDLKIISADNPPNIICVGYATANIYSSSDMIIAQLNWDKYIFIRNSSFASVADCQTGMAGKTIYYELATPNAPIQLDPIQNSYLPTESGGTISSILTDAVDDSMTLGYINL